MTACAWPNCVCSDTGPCFVTGDDPADLGAFVDRSALDGDAASTSFRGGLSDTYFLVVAVGPDGQFGPVAPDIFVP